MDKVIQKNRRQKVYQILGGVTGGLVLLLLLVRYQTSNASTASLNVDDSKIIVSEVKKGVFKEYIPVNGVILPLTTIYLDATEGGKVEDLYVEEGAVVKKEQPLLRLSNTDLELDLLTRETSVFDLITNMQNTRNLAEQNSIRQQNQLAEVDNALVEADRVYKVNKRLYEQKVIPEQDFKSSQNLYGFQVRRKKLIEQTLKQDSVTMNQQISQMKESLERMKAALVVMRKKAGDLVVKAPIDGQLTSRNAEVGESKTRGQRLGQIDVSNGFKVRADIDEHYISRIFIGQIGDFAFSGKDYSLRISKIYTQVNNGKFQVDLEFTKDIPSGIRRGQNLQVKLSLSDESQAVLLPRGGFFQQTGGNWVFVYDPVTNTAKRVNIQLGRQNPQFFEVIDGLSVNDKVITSSYENYGEMKELKIKL